MDSSRALLLATAYLLAAQLVAGGPLEIKETVFPCHRLPVNVEPTKYELHLEFPSLESNSYKGSVNIWMKFSNYTTEKLAAWGLGDVACAQEYDPNSIVLHADKSLAIQDIELTSFPFETPSKSQRKIQEFVRDEARQMIAIPVGETIDGAEGKLSISFKGSMRNDKRGVYLSTYNDGERVYKHIVSQFQPTFARTAFPCFDEPRFRVPFSVRVTHPGKLTAYGNTEAAEVYEEGDLTTTRFATTPKMPVHMVAFAIGEFDEPLELVSTSRGQEKRGNKKDRKIRLITAPGKRETGEYALEIAKKSLESFEEYIDYDFPLNKLDIIAIADLDRNNTESWGLAFVRDTLLWIDNETKPETRLTTALNIAHVVAHQWFGNLISARWWSDLWITEGVAAQFSLDYVESRPYPMGGEFLVRLDLLSVVLDADQTGGLHPLSPSEENLQTSEQIYGLFDDLEFVKSASMAQMVRDVVGYRKYQKIRRNLIKEYAYKTVSSQDYRNATLNTFGPLKGNFENLPDLLETFPKYTGVPLVQYSFQEGTSDLRMELMSFTEARQDVDELKKRPNQGVAINIERCPSSLSFEGWILNTNNEFGRSADSTCDQLDFDPSIGTYYRTLYTDDVYAILQERIEHRRLMYPMTRLYVLDDANSLVKAGLIGQEQFKSLLDLYANDEDPGVVLALLAATNTYRDLFSQDETDPATVPAIQNIFEDYWFNVSGHESLPMQRAREVVLTSMIETGNKTVLDAAVKAFEDGDVALFLRQPVYKALVLTNSERVEELLSKLSETKSYEERIRLVSALTLSKDKGVLRRVKQWLDSSGLKEETKRPFLDSISEALSE